MKKIAKFTLLWITALSVVFFLMGIDSLTIEQGILWAGCSCLLIFLSYICLTEEEVKKYSGANFFEKLIKKPNYED